MIDFLREVVLDGFLDYLKLLPFLFLAYLLMEWIEHGTDGRAERIVTRVGRFGPPVGSALGVVPQCGFGTVASNFYVGRIISMGTLVAVYLSTSDEMLPILLTGGVPIVTVLVAVGYKMAVGMLVGFTLDLLLRARKAETHIEVDELCEHDNCHCERGVLHSAVHHTLTISLFLLLVTFAINTLVFFIGEDVLGSVLRGAPGLSHAVAVLVGLIPNCAASVVLTKFYVAGLLTPGTMLAGLLPGAGVGLAVLFRLNRHPKENLLILGILAASGFVFGLLFDLTGLGALLPAV